MFYLCTKQLTLNPLYTKCSIYLRNSWLWTVTRLFVHRKFTNWKFTNDFFLNLTFWEPIKKNRGRIVRGRIVMSRLWTPYVQNVLCMYETVDPEPPVYKMFCLCTKPECFFVFCVARQSKKSETTKRNHGCMIVYWCVYCVWCVLMCTQCVNAVYTMCECFHSVHNVWMLLMRNVSMLLLTLYVNMYTLCNVYMIW